MELQMESKTTQVTKRPVHITGIAGGFEPRLCSLEQALAYRDDQILYKFQERWDVSFEEASELFEETKKCLWLQVAARKQSGSPHSNDRLAGHGRRDASHLHSLHA